jgi:hypothetical protein
MPFTESYLQSRITSGGNNVAGDEDYTTRPADTGGGLAPGIGPAGPPGPPPDTSAFITNGGGINVMKKISRADYDALDVKDPTTAYWIVG